jgi:hypothetical protein
MKEIQLLLGRGMIEDCSGIVPGFKCRIFKHFAGMVTMDRARQDWVYEYAETG